MNRSHIMQLYLLEISFPHIIVYSSITDLAGTHMNILYAI